MHGVEKVFSKGLLSAVIVVHFRNFFSPLTTSRLGIGAQQPGAG